MPRDNSPPARPSALTAPRPPGGRTVVPAGVSSRSAGCCQYATLHDKRDIADVVQVRIINRGQENDPAGGRWALRSTGPALAVISRDAAGTKRSEGRDARRTGPTGAASEDGGEGPRAEDCGWPLSRRYERGSKWILP